jgi:rubrerythrin
MGIKGIMECERATLQAWLELVDWTGLEVLPGSQVPRKMKLNMDSKGAMHQWLALAELRCGITDHDDAQMFTNNGRELSALAKAIREQTPNAEDRVQSMSGGEVLCTALIAWLRDGDDSLEVSQKVVEMVWPRACAGWPQTQQSWKSEGATKLELLSEIETELRKGGARCQQHLTRLGYYCPHCQHGSCTVCNDKEGRIQCPRCQTPFPHMTPVHRQQVRTHAYAPPCLNLHALGDQWIGEVSDVDIVQNPQEDSHEGDQLIFKALKI